MEGLSWGVIVSAITALGALYAIYQSRGKEKAQSENLTVDSASKLVETVMNQLDYLDGEVEELRRTIAEYRVQVEEAAKTEQRLSAEIRSLRRTVRILVEFIQDHGLEPPSLELANGETYGRETPENAPRPPAEDE